MRRDRPAAGFAPWPATAKAPEERDRKAEHIQLALERRMQWGGGFFDDYRLEHQALPEIALDQVDLAVEFLGKRLAAPILVSCMTGGTETAGRINRNLATAAERLGLALGVGSQRKALEDRGKADSFRVRDAAPSVPLLANLGAVQLNYGMGLPECEAVVAMIGADALAFHLNPLQEAIQPEGQGDFRGLLGKLGEVARGLSVPAIAKEIGSGLSGRVARMLYEEGFRIFDTAGTGGTSWARIEGERAGDPELGEVFAGWGIPTPESIAALAQLAQDAELPGITVIGSGGIRNGVDAAKAIALGADLVGLAYPFLEAAAQSAERVVERAERIVQELRIAMFCAGAGNVAELKQATLERRRA